MGPGPWSCMALLFRPAPLPVWMAPDHSPARREAPARPGRGPGLLRAHRGPQGSFTLARRQRRFPLPGPGPAASLATATPGCPPPPSPAGLLPEPRAPAHSPGDPGPAPGFLSRCPRASFLLFEGTPPPTPVPDRPREPRLACPVGAPGHAPSCAACCPQDGASPPSVSKSYLQQPGLTLRPQGRPGGSLYHDSPSKGRWGRLGAGVQAGGPIAPGAGDRAHGLTPGVRARPCGSWCSGISLPGVGRRECPEPGAAREARVGGSGETPGGTHPCKPPRDTCPPAGGLGEASATVTLGGVALAETRAPTWAPALPAGLSGASLVILHTG